MKRYAQDIALMDRRVREWKALSFSAADVERGRFRKRKPLDCGRARCGLCHSEKRFGRPAARQRRADQAFAHDLQVWQSEQS